MLMELGKKQLEIDLLKKTGFYRGTLEVSNSKGRFFHGVYQIP